MELRELVHRTPLVACERPQILGGVRSGQFWVERQGDEGQYDHLEQNPVHYTTNHSNL